MKWGKSGFSCWGVKGSALSIFFYANVFGMRPRSRFSSVFEIPAPWVLLRLGRYFPLFPKASHFLAGNREAELKLITFFSLLLFHDFLCFLFS